MCEESLFKDGNSLPPVPSPCANSCTGAPVLVFYIFTRKRPSALEPQGFLPFVQCELYVLPKG